MIGECKAIFTKDRLIVYTPFYYSLEEIEYFSANSSFSEDETQEEIEEVKEIEEIVAHHEPVPREITTSEVTPSELPKVNYYVAPYELPIPFPRRLAQHAEEVLVHKTMESLKKSKVKSLLLKEIRQADDYAKHIKNLVCGKLEGGLNSLPLFNLMYSLFIKT
ncbi:hypothetical protein Tco_0266764 [Tanacetum coccineum]